MNIVILEGYAVNPGDLSWDFLNQYGTVTVYDTTSQDQIIPRSVDADMILVNKVSITREIMDACPNLKLICVLATGYNCIDCAAAREKGIPVCNVPAYSTESVTQLTFALLLELCNHVGLHSDHIHEGKWCSSKYFCYWETPQIRLAGKTMGIIGFGKIGKAVGTVAKALGMNVLAYNPSHTEEGAKIGTYVDLPDLLKNSDVVSLHCPLKENNHKLINKDTISQMKNGAIIINTARGPLIDEQDLSDALRSGKLAGAGMDVLETEPMDPTNPLMNAPNCVITPHIAWTPIEARRQILKRTDESIAGFMKGTPCNVVN